MVSTQKESPAFVKPPNIAFSFSPGVRSFSWPFVMGAAVARGRGLGRSLLTDLVAQAEQAGIWTIQAGVLTNNTASRALLAGCGFREVGTRERLGKLDGTWRDVVLLERRSTSAGL